MNQFAHLVGFTGHDDSALQCHLEEMLIRLSRLGIEGSKYTPTL